MVDLSTHSSQSSKMKRRRQSITGILLLAFVLVVIIRFGYERNLISSLSVPMKSWDGGFQDLILGSKIARNSTVTSTVMDTKVSTNGTDQNGGPSNTANKVTFVVRLNGEFGNHVSSSHAASFPPQPYTTEIRRSLSV
jgi:hypothetical protein